MSDHRGRERMKVSRAFRTRDETLRTSAAWEASRIPEQGALLCFAEGLNQGLVSSVTQAILQNALFEKGLRTADGWHVFLKRLTLVFFK